mmetsp:Transcript_1399/g.1844  ORF Transcript_1399/g.1844 Transcript_1399/m.1844 type:complete len:236 (-) Transcript_1399:1735-2442(-)
MGGQSDDLNSGAEWISAYLLKHYEKEFKQAASKGHITHINCQKAHKTAAMMAEAKITKASLRVIAKHLKAWAGESILAKETDLDQLNNTTCTHRRFGKFSFKSPKGKKVSSKDTKEREQDLTIEYWVSSPFDSVENELIQRTKSKTSVTGFNFPLLSHKRVAVGFQADHGNEAFIVPCKAIIGSFSSLFNKIILTEPCDDGSEHQKILVDATDDNTVAGSGSFIVNRTRCRTWNW